MDNHTSTSRAEAERLLGVASKLLRNKDLPGSKQFAILAQDTEPLLEGSDQILTIIEVLLAAENRINNHPDWYSVLQIPPKTNDFDLIKKQYRRLALLLHPDKNKFAFAESAFHLVADAWGVLSDPVKKSVFDCEFGDLGHHFSRVDLEESRRRKEQDSQNMKHQEFARDKFPVRRNTAAMAASGGVASDSTQSRKRGRPKGSFGRGKVSSNGVSSGSGGRGGGGGGHGGGGGGIGEQTPPTAGRSENFWTACPYCYNLYEYPKMYEGCCMRCAKCKKGFSAEGVGYEPPVVPGREEYYCCWGMFPMGFNDESWAGRGRARRGGAAKGFENWMPVMQSGGKPNVGNVNLKATPKLVEVPVVRGSVNVAPTASPVPVATASVTFAPVAAVGANAAASVAPGSSSAPRKRGRPRKNPLP